jgi:hypothetical protein
MKKKPNATDQAIEREYYLQAQGRLISVLKITAFFSEARKKIEEGKTAELAVAELLPIFTFTQGGN